MTIYKNRFYLMARTPGISGFQEWEVLELRIATGRKAAANRGEVVAEFDPRKLDCGSCLAGAKLRFEDGNAPERQAVVIAENIATLLPQTPYNTLFLAKIKKSELDQYMGDPALKFF